MTAITHSPLAHWKNHRIDQKGINPRWGLLVGPIIIAGYVLQGYYSPGNQRHIENPEVLEVLAGSDSYTLTTMTSPLGYEINGTYIQLSDLQMMTGSFDTRTYSATVRVKACRKCDYQTIENATLTLERYVNEDKLKMITALADATTYLWNVSIGPTVVNTLETNQ